MVEKDTTSPDSSTGSEELPATPQPQGPRTSVSTPPLTTSTSSADRLAQIVTTSVTKVLLDIGVIGPDGPSKATPTAGAPVSTPKRGGLTTTAKGDVPFTGEELKPRSVYAIRSDDLKSKENLESRISKGTGVVYKEGGDHAFIDWHRVFKKQILDLGLDAEFTITYGTETYHLLDDYAQVEYPVVEHLIQQGIKDGDYDQFSIDNFRHIDNFIAASIDPALYRKLDKYQPKNNGVLIFHALTTLQRPIAEPTARALLDKFRNDIHLSSYAGENIEAMTSDISKILEEVVTIDEDMIPKDVVNIILVKAQKATSLTFRMEAVTKAQECQGTKSSLTLVGDKVVSTSARKPDWRAYLMALDAQYKLECAEGWEGASTRTLKAEAELKGMVTKLNNEISTLKNQLKKQSKSDDSGTAPNTNTQQQSAPRSGGGKKMCYVCGEDHFANECQKGNKPKRMPPEGAKEVITIGDQTWVCCRKCHRWYKKGATIAHTTAEHKSKPKPTEQGRVAASTQNEIASVSEGVPTGHPDDDYLEVEE